MRTKHICRVNNKATNTNQCSSDQRIDSNNTPTWIKAVEIGLMVAAIGGALSPIMVEGLKFIRATKLQVSKKQNQKEKEDLRHKNKTDEITHQADEKIRVMKEKFHLQQNAKGSWGTPIVVQQKGSTAEEPSPIEKYVKAYYESGKNLQPTRIADSPSRPQESLIGNSVRIGNFTMFVGASGVGKSILMIAAGFAAAEGRPMVAMPYLGEGNLSPMQVLYFSSEKMADVFKERGYGKQPDLFSFYDNVHFKTPRECLETIYKLAPHDENCLIELDGITSMFIGEKGCDNIAVFLGIFRQIQDDLSKRGISWTLLTSHHTTKHGTDKKKIDRSEIKGSADWDIFADSTIMLLPGERPNERYLRPMKCRDFPDECHLTHVMRLKDTPRLHFEYVRTMGLPQRKTWKKMYRREIEKILELKQQGMKIPEIARKMGRDYNAIKKVLKQHQ